MDRYWYHVLLKGAVKHASKIEERYKDKIPGIGFGGTISEVSGAVKVFGRKMNSDSRLTSFYMLGFVMLALVFFSLFLAVSDKPPSASNAQPQPAAAQTPAAKAPGT